MIVYEDHMRCKLLSNRYCRHREREREKRVVNAVGVAANSDQCGRSPGHPIRVCSANRLDIKYIVLLSSNRIVLL